MIQTKQQETSVCSQPYWIDLLMSGNSDGGKEQSGDSEYDNERLYLGTMLSLVLCVLIRESSRVCMCVRMVATLQAVSHAVLSCVVLLRPHLFGEINSELICAVHFE